MIELFSCLRDSSQATDWADQILSRTDEKMRNSKDLFLVIIYLFIGSALFTTSSCQTTNTTAGSGK